MAAEHYDVRVLSTPGSVARIQAAGLDAVALMDAADGVLSSIANPPHAVGYNPIRMHRQFRQALRLLSGLGTQIRELYRCDPPDLLIADFTLPTAGLAARQLGVPWWTSLPSPCVIETPDGPPAYLGGLSMSRSVGGRSRDAAGRALVRLFKHGMFRMHRRTLRAAGLSSPYRPDGSEAVYSPETILALGLPALEFPRQWPAAVRFIGPILYTPPTRSAAPDFRDGYRHVLVSLGTHLAWHKDEFASRVREVAREFPRVMFHFSDGGPGDSRAEPAGNFQRLPFVDYERWLSRYDLVIHHGGAGIMHYCIAHAKPALVYPLDYDQFDHAARQVRAGLALRVSRARDLGALLRQALDHGTDLQRRGREFQTILARTAAERPLLQLLRLRLGP